MDGAGFNGPALRELTDPSGLNLDVTVPPPQMPPRATFGPERFSLTVLEDDKAEATCPQGHTTRQREPVENGYKYIFKPSQCSGCPLRQECLQNPASKKGRTVIKNTYEAEYRKVRAKATTPAYAETRRLHPQIERKLGELVRHHDLRHARYRGQPKVLGQALLTSLVVNIKAMVKAIGQKIASELAGVAVRAAMATA